MTIAQTKILVWDAPVRVFHWLLVLSFVGAYLTADIERWRLAHVSLGYTLGGLVAFRLLWELMGTRHVRFRSFVRGPSAVTRYLRAMLRGQPEHHVGHNPAGAVAIMLLLLLGIASVVSGWAIYNELGVNLWVQLHDIASNVLLAVVGLHVAGVLVTSTLHGENLVRSMVTGNKDGVPHEGIRRAWRGLALVILLAVLGYWWLQWQRALALSASGGAGATQNDKQGSHERNNDESAAVEPALDADLPDKPFQRRVLARTHLRCARYSLTAFSRSASSSHGSRQMLRKAARCCSAPGRSLIIRYASPMYS